MRLIVAVLIVASVFASTRSQHNAAVLVQPKNVGIAYLIPIFHPIQHERNDFLSNEVDKENDGKHIQLHGLLFPLTLSTAENFKNSHNKPIRSKGEIVFGRQKRSPSHKGGGGCGGGCGGGGLFGGGGGYGHGGGGGFGGGGSGSWSQASASSGSWGGGGGRGGGFGGGKGKGYYGK